METEKYCEYRQEKNTGFGNLNCIGCVKKNYQKCVIFDIKEKDRLANLATEAEIALSIKRKPSRIQDRLFSWI